jgi:hypothetical protein
MNEDGNDEWGKLTPAFRELFEKITNSSLFFLRNLKISIPCTQQYSFVTNNLNTNIYADSR